MSCKTETKYLTLKFIYGSRILNIREGLIVCGSDKIELLYNDIVKKLLVNHVDKDSNKFFYLFCNSKLCNSKLNKTFNEIFGLSPYVINVILKREFFNKDNLIKKNNPVKLVTKTRKVTQELSRDGIEEISSYEFVEDLVKNSSISDKREMNFSLFKSFFKLRLREDIILIDLLKKFNISELSQDLDIKSEFPDILHLINLELNSSEIMRRPIILYYQSLFSVEQLKAILSEKDNKLINLYLTGIEKFGIDTNHSGCLAEQELRKILTNDKSLHTFMKFIESNDHYILLHSLSLFQKYAEIVSTKTEKKILKTDKHIDFSKIVNQPIKVQSGGSIEKFNNLRRILEIQGEPRHDFGKGVRAVLPENMDKNFFGKDTEENAEFNQISGILTGDIGYDGLFLGSHEAKYFLNFYKKVDYHIQHDIKEINSRFRFFRFKDSLNLEMNVYQDDISGISHDIANSSSVSGIRFLKETLLNDNVKHYLFDTSASISGTTCFKDCLSGRTFSRDCSRGGESDRDREVSSEICKVSGSDITEIVPLVKFWDPASANFTKFSKTIKELQDSGGKLYIDMMTTLFMNNVASDVEFSPPVGFDDFDNIWYPKRASLSDDYQVKFNSKILNQIQRGETPDENRLIIKLKNTEKDFFIKEGFSVRNLSYMIQLLLDEGMSSPRLEGKLKKPIHNAYREITKYLFEAIKNGTFTRKQVLKILLDMKKSGDWSLIKWTQINNKYFWGNHKTILYTGDVLCGLFSIINDVPTLFGTTSIESYNPFNYINNLGKVSFIENRTLAYYSGRDKDFTYNDFLQKHDYIADSLFEIGSNRSADGYPERVFNLSDPHIKWDDGDFSNIKEKLPRLISEIEKNPESKSYIFMGNGSVLGRLQEALIEYQQNYEQMKKDEEDGEPDSERLVKSLHNWNIIVNVFKKLENIARDDFFSNTLEAAQSVFSLMLDFTTTYTYIGIGAYSKEPYKIFIPQQVQTEIKSRLKAISGKDDAPESVSTDHPAQILNQFRRKKPYEEFTRFRQQINDNIFKILGEFGTDSIEGVCNEILNIWGGVSEPVPRNIRMGHFVRDISVILEIIMKTGSVLDVFDVFPRTIIQINEDIETLNLEDDSQTLDAKKILHKLKKDIITSSLGGHAQASEILTQLGAIKRLYECFTELFNDMADKGDEIARLSEIHKQDQQDAYVKACESIDSLNSNLQLYFGYVDIRPPSVAGAATAAEGATAAEAATVAGAAES